MSWRHSALATPITRSGLPVLAPLAAQNDPATSSYPEHRAGDLCRRPHVRRSFIRQSHGRRSH